MMTEVDWDDPRLVTRLVREQQAADRLSDRKARLFGVACCRRASESVFHLTLSHAIDVCEARADEPLHPAVRAAERAVWRVVGSRNWLQDGEWNFDEAEAVADLAAAVLDLCQFSPSPAFIAERVRMAICGLCGWWGRHGEALFQSDLLLDITGRLADPWAFDPDWRTTPAVGLARTMYESGDFDRLPILADALEEVGCDQPDLLAHLRDPGLTHVRGCWAVDLVLGKS